MASYNRIIFAGHLAADPVGKLVGKDMACRFTLVYNAKWQDKDGKDLEEVCFVDVETWRKQADIAMKYLKKGHMTLVEGRLKQAKWVKDGVERSKHLIACDKIVLIEPKDTTPKGASVKVINANQATDKSGADKSGADKSGEIDPREIDDLPF